MFESSLPTWKAMQLLLFVTHNWGKKISAIPYCVWKIMPKEKGGSSWPIAILLYPSLPNGLPSSTVPRQMEMRPWHRLLWPEKGQNSTNNPQGIYVLQNPRDRYKILARWHRVSTASIKYFPRVLHCVGDAGRKRDWCFMPSCLAISYKVFGHSLKTRFCN